MSDPEIRFQRPGLIDWSRIFSRVAPVELELGFGKARFLLASARERPGVDFFGVERSRKWFREGRRRILQDAPPNLRICRAEALDFLARRVPPASLRALHVYHPDPWPKRRHRKRRLVTPALLAQAARCLEAGGHLRITTDHADYGREIASLLADAPGFLSLDWDDAAVDSHFEAKYLAQGRLIHRYHYQRVEGS